MSCLMIIVVAFKVFSSVTFFFPFIIDHRWSFNISSDFHCGLVYSYVIKHAVHICKSINQNLDLYFLMQIRWKFIREIKFISKHFLPKTAQKLLMWWSCPPIFYTTPYAIFWYIFIQRFSFILPFIVLSFSLPPIIVFVWSQYDGGNMRRRLSLDPNIQHLDSMVHI